jgi:hypothetical protein
MKKDIFVPVLIVILLTLILEPFGFMPSMATMTLLVTTTALFLFFAVFAWREKGADEREETHIHRADRFGFIAGMTVLIVGILFDYFFMHEVSQILVIALIIMIASKAIALWYSRGHN